MNTCSMRSARRNKRGQAGVAAIELAFLLPILVVFMTFPIFYARCLWHYTVAQKAAQDAARYVSTVARAEMISPDSAAEVRLRAIQIANMEIAELSPGTAILGPEVFCDQDLCGQLEPGVLPTTVRVRLNFGMVDPNGIIDFGWFGLRITANHTLRYVGT